ncbi:MAG: aa3-type cytochrome c oxidase subunit IV [Pseudomonadota bacterium]
MAKKSQDKVPENAMDYPEHERTYERFIKFSIWTTAACVALLVAMTFGFFGGGGLIGGTLLFVVLMVACFFAL